MGIVSEKPGPLMQKTITVAVINGEKKLLILRRGSTAPWMPNRYCLPGGHIEDGESLEDGAKRELYEETGIDCYTKDFLGLNLYFGGGYSKIILILNLPAPDINLNWEHTDYAWIDSNDVTKYNLVPRLKSTISKLLAGGFIC